LIPVDNEVDNTFAEPVVLRPMTTVSSGYREAIPDASRIEVIARGIYDQGQGAVENTVGLTRQAIVDTTLSIRHEPVDQCQLRKGDRVYFPDRDETYDVTYISEEPGGRPEVHLVRIIE
jgi:hypothetical protein